jgi:hypothetical protein
MKCSRIDVRRPGRAALVRWLAGAAVAAVGVLTPAAHAQDAVRGKQLYFNTNGAPKSCGTTGCHDGFPTTKKNKIQNGANNPSLILSAISKNTGSMGFLGPYVNATDAADIAAYIGNPAAANGPAIALAPTTLAFPNQTSGTTSTALTVTVSNTGGAALTLSAFSLAGTNAAEFTLAGGSTCTAGGSVAAGGNCTLKVAFAPTAAGSKSASLSITHNAAGSPSTVALSGTASTPVATITLSPSSLTFPNTPLGSTSATQTITLTNSGSAALTLSALTAGGSHPGDFVRSGTCAAGGTVAAGASCSIAYAFAPGAVGARSAQLSIASNNSGGTVTINLSGSGVDNTPTIGLSASALAFGTVQVGQTSGARTVTVTNTGGGQLAVSGATASGAGFSASGCAGASLANNQSCTISVSFAPAAAGTVNGSLSIAHNAAGSPSSVSLSGSGSAAPVPVVSLSRASIAFSGVLAINQSSVNERVVFSNAGPGSATIASITASGDFAVAGGASGACAAGQVLAQGASCTIDLRFTPTADGNRTGTLTVTSNGSPADATSALTGTASAVAAPAVSAPTRVDFGKLPAGAAAAPQPVTITNSGATNLVVNALTLSGPFVIASPGTCGAAPFTLVPGQSCTLQVSFTATASGMQTGALTVQSNCPTTATVQLQAEVLSSVSTTAAGVSNAGFGGGALSLEILALLALLVVAAAYVRGREADAAERARKTSEDPSIS